MPAEKVKESFDRKFFQILRFSYEFYSQKVNAYRSFAKFWESNVSYSWEIVPKYDFGPFAILIF